MRIGLVTDIHNEADLLSRALAALEARGIDLLVTIGDTCDVFMPEGGTVEVATLLQERAQSGSGATMTSCCAATSTAVTSPVTPAVRSSTSWPGCCRPWSLEAVISATSSRLATHTTSLISGR